MVCAVLGGAARKESPVARVAARRAVSSVAASAMRGAIAALVPTRSVRVDICSPYSSHLQLQNIPTSWEGSHKL
uniref:Uncharacterized protein n=1 Tax=Streptomyces rochei TaxID=1928 RepID=A0A1B1WA57_STRRO|nr:hypothetical protein [Streptomyces rochei]